MNGGEGGIRTHVPVISRQPDFESGPLRPLRYLSAAAECRQGISTYTHNDAIWQAFSCHIRTLYSFFMR